MSRRLPEKRRRPTKITIPEQAGPHVKLVFAEMRRQCITYDDAEAGSGVLRATLKAWRHRSAPSLTNLEAVLGLLGFDLVPVPRSKVLPPEVVEALKPVADQVGLTMPQVAQAVVEIVARIHDRFEAPPALPAPARPLALPPPRRQGRVTHPDQQPLFPEVSNAA